MKTTPGHKKGTRFQEGPLIGKSADLGSFALFPENADHLRSLNKRLKLFYGEDGWFARGRLGQVWEYGVGKLGFTVGTGIMIRKAIAAGFTPTQCGGGEANFSCLWTWEMVGKLVDLLKLGKRKASSVGRNAHQMAQMRAQVSSKPLAKVA